MTTPVEIIPANDVALLQEKLTKALAGEITVFISQREVNGVKVEITDLPETATNTALIIESSGSTGIPKRIYLSADALRQFFAESTQEILCCSSRWSSGFRICG